MLTRTPANLLLMLLAGLSLCLPGCETLYRWTRPDPFGTSSACRIQDPTDASQVVQILNERGPSKLYAWQANNVSITARGEGMAIPLSLKATLAVQAPRNFRMTARAFMNDDVDIGSNDERFWFWLSQAQPQFVFTARHDRIAEAQQKFPIPFQPDWIIEALGVIPLDEKEVRLVHVPNAPRGRRWGRLISQRVSPQGTPVRKETLVDLCHGIILEHALYDNQNRLMAKARLSQHNFEPTTGAVLPNHIELDWPMTRMALTLQIGPVQVNPQQVPPQLFALPNRNCPVKELGGTPGTADARPIRSSHRAVSLTGNVEDDELPESTPMFRPASNPAIRGRVGFKPEPEEFLE